MSPSLMRLVWTTLKTSDLIFLDWNFGLSGVVSTSFKSELKREGYLEVGIGQLWDGVQQC